MEKIRVLEAYRKADMNKRLHLFLQYPEYREKFFSIEVEAASTSRPSIKK